MGRSRAQAGVRFAAPFPRGVRPRAADERGYALLSVFLLVVLIGGLVGTSLLGTRIGMQSTSNLVAAGDAFYAAESGLLHALSVINGRGVISFGPEIADRWETPELFGPGEKEMPGHPRLRYEVLVAADPVAPEDQGELTVTGYASDRAMHVLRIGLCKGPLLPTGAIHILRKSSCSTFRGNAFWIDGNDHQADGRACTEEALQRGLCRGGSVPGISTVDPETEKCVEEALREEQRDNIAGEGSPPSVIRTGGTDVEAMRELVAHVLRNPNVVTRPEANLVGRTRLGTDGEPQITHLSYPGTVTLGGRTTGAGIVVADGDVRLVGNMRFTGWIIVGGELVVLGNANVLGSIWTGAFRMVAGGSMSVDYCAACLELIDHLPGTATGNFPRLMQVCRWSEGA